MKKIIISVFTIIMCINIAFLATSALAKPGINNATSMTTNAANAIGYKINSGDLTSVIGSFIQIILGLLGLLFLILVIISGIQWMMAGGNENAVKTSKARMQNASLGLAITLLAYIISYYIVNLLANQALS